MARSDTRSTRRRVLAHAFLLYHGGRIDQAALLRTIATFRKRR